MDVQLWWKALRRRCAPFGKPAPLSSIKLIERCKSALTWAIDPAEGGDMDARFALPDGVADYLALLEDTEWFGHRVMLDFLLWPPSMIARAVEAERPSYYDDEELVLEAGLWIPLGTWSDKHTWYLCCDRARAQFGGVFDAHDDTPWLSGLRSIYGLMPFEQWLERLSKRRIHRPDTALAIALTPEELETFDRTRTQGTLEEAVWWARDLEFKLIPDSAWADRQGQPDRIARLDDVLPPELVTPEIPELIEGDAALALLPAAALPAYAEAGCHVWRWNEPAPQSAADSLNTLATRAHQLSGHVLLMRDLDDEQDDPDDP